MELNYESLINEYKKRVEGVLPKDRTSVTERMQKDVFRTLMEQVFPTLPHELHDITYRIGMDRFDLDLASSDAIENFNHPYDWENLLTCFGYAGRTIMMAYQMGRNA